MISGIRSFSFSDLDGTYLCSRDMITSKLFLLISFLSLPLTNAPCQYFSGSSILFVKYSVPN